ncbi:hypothetical protein EVAR_51188_1 [Eumeta japonica]|uniref:Uncharacterized protein n=1 Tax=Eumeta variegata TaxID=151549 RepID=A0A4C1XFS9_EUMVA|nr:hypothetical protein EVAR_51188_1 [Eumeta japonica]
MDLTSNTPCRNAGQGLLTDVVTDSGTGGLKCTAQIGLSTLAPAEEESLHSGHRHPSPTCARAASSQGRSEVIRLDFNGCSMLQPLPAPT